MAFLGIIDDDRFKSEMVGEFEGRKSQPIMDNIEWENQKWFDSDKFRENVERMKCNWFNVIEKLQFSSMLNTIKLRYWKYLQTRTRAIWKWINMTLSDTEIKNTIDDKKYWEVELYGI